MTVNLKIKITYLKGEYFMQMPKLLIISIPKCGTNLLWQVLLGLPHTQKRTQCFTSWKPGYMEAINQIVPGDVAIQKVSKNELYRFDSRAELEEKLAAGQSEWYVEPFAGVKRDIGKYIIPQLKSMAIKYLEHFDQVRSNSREIKGAVRYIAVGGAAKLAQKQILEAAVKWSERGRPIELMFPKDMEKLNVLGLMILAKMNQLKKEKGSSLAVSVKG